MKSTIKLEATATDRVFDLPLKAEAKVISILILEKEDWQQVRGLYVLVIGMKLSLLSQ